MSSRIPFSITEEHFGEVVTVDLKEGGRDVEVTEGNKKDYVEYVLLCRSCSGLNMSQSRNRVSYLPTGI